MKFEHKLIRGTLLQRYKRFLADVKLENGEIITAHCANSGSMMGLKEEGSPVWLSPATNPKAKLDYRWELVEADGTLVGINTFLPNAIAEEAILRGAIKELQGYKNLRREVKYGTNSRIDILLSDSSTGSPDCYVEVKSVTLSREQTIAEFPDSVTARGTKHLQELSQMVTEGYRAVMLYLVQREDCSSFRIASDIDPAYGDALQKAHINGVEAFCYGCKITPEQIILKNAVPIMDLK